MNFKKFHSDKFREEYFYFKHESGLKIYVCPKEMSNTYAVFSTSFGSSLEEYVEDNTIISLPQGCAHFLEHKLFDNEDGHGSDDVFTSYGAYDNAFTGNDRTAYLFNCTENFEACLYELLSFVTKPYFTEASVKKEMGIIAEEIRGCFDDPYDRCYMNMLCGLYENNPVRKDICGTEETISKINPEILYKCHKTFYTPDNMILTVCGNITPEVVINVVDSVITKPDTPFKAHRKTIFEKPESFKKKTEIFMPVGKPLFSIGVKDMIIPSDKRELLKKTEAANILCQMLFSESSEFYLELLMKNLISPSFECRYSTANDVAFVCFSGDSIDPIAVYDAIISYISEISAKGLDVESFIREKRSLYASYITDFDSTEDIAFELMSFADYDIGLFEYPDIIENITFDYINDLFNQLFKEEFFTISIVFPSNEERKEEDLK